MSLAQRGALNLATQHLEAGEYALAIRKADQALIYAEATPEVEAHATFLKALALEGLGRLHEAARLYRYLAQQYAQTAWGFQAAGRLDELASDGYGWNLGQRADEADGERRSVVSLVVDRPWLAHPVEIFYPPALQSQGVEGYVIVRVRSDERGELIGFEVLEASHPEFAASARASISRFRMVPSELVDEDPPLTKTLRLEFSLAGED